jgi:hypothetical protein
MIIESLLILGAGWLSGRGTAKTVSFTVSLMERQKLTTVHTYYGRDCVVSDAVEFGLLEPFDALIIRLSESGEDPKNVLRWVVLWAIGEGSMTEVEVDKFNLVWWELSEGEIALLHRVGSFFAREVPEI